MEIDSYHNKIIQEVKKQYEIIGKLKPINIPLASDVADKIEGLLSVLNQNLIKSGLADFIREAEKKYGPNDWRVAIDSAIATADSKFIKFENIHDAIEMGIRVGLAYITSAIVSAPLEGFVKLEFKKRMDGQEYFACHFGGPIRGAGGTAAASVVVIADALRANFGYGKYDATEQEISRVKVEVTDYNDYEARLQYLPSSIELDFLLKNIPIEIDGDPTSDREVSAYKDLPRIKTNRIRSGMCLVLCEGFAQKSNKVNKLLKGFAKNYKIEDDFSFLVEYLKIKELSHAEKDSSEKENTSSQKVLPNYRYIEELAAGRPVFSYPLTSGGFRLRYGRSRTSGLAAASVNPATNKILMDFIATGSQLRVELPGKACAVTPCSTIDGPIVKLKNGSVRRINNAKLAEQVLNDIEEILYIGDILFNYGDFSEQGHLLMPSPFVSEWWDRIVESKGETAVNESKRLSNFVEYKDFSLKYGIPLHPKFLYFWSQISYKQLTELIESVHANAKIEYQNEIPGSAYKILILPLEESIKRTLELLAVEHYLKGNNIIIDNADAFLFTLGYNNVKFDALLLKIGQNFFNLDLLSSISGLKIMDIAGTFIGGRLGRPEKAKMREMDTNPNVIFPIGESGGSSRNIIIAAQKPSVLAEYGLFYCDKCKKDSIFTKCDVCGTETRRLRYCRVCGVKTTDSFHHGKPTSQKSKQSINLKEYLDRAFNRLEIRERPTVIKGVKGVFNSNGDIEPLEKGILRAINGLNVNKDGTIRFDAIEVPITHFKPKEVGTSIEKLKELGYTEDIYGKELSNREQILQLKQQDIILPTYGNSNENAAEVFSRVSNFIDELLMKYYSAEKMMDVKSREDLVGKLVVGLAPHTSSGTIGRIVGFSKTQGLFAHPFFHAAMRRNCDGDEAALMLLTDMLLNFDRGLLPDSRGARYMDSPLVISSKLDLESIDSEAYNLDIVDKYPLEFYEATLNYAKPSDVKIMQVKDIFKDPYRTIFFTHDTDDINEGVNVSSYKTLGTMLEKVSAQMALQEKIRAVDASDVAKIIIDKHFIKDIKGNLRRFGTQEFRCVKCNERYRRAPLIGKCLKCGGNLVLTSSEGNIKKYLSISLNIAQKYHISQYLKDELHLLDVELDSIFGEKIEKQTSLLAF
jgi:DNA polymerase II large subunit